MLAFLKSALTALGDGHSAFDATPYQYLSGCSARRSVSQYVRNVRFATIRTHSNISQCGMFGRLANHRPAEPAPSQQRIIASRDSTLDLAAPDQFGQIVGDSPAQGHDRERGILLRGCRKGRSDDIGVVVLCHAYRQGAPGAPSASKLAKMRTAPGTAYGSCRYQA